MYSPEIVIEALLNGLMLGAIYALIALGLTLIYGVLHIVNFAHGALLTVAMFAVWVLSARFGMDPYLSIAIVAPLMFAFGYVLQRFIIGPASHGKDNSILLVTLGLSIIIENALLAGFQSDTRTINTDYSFRVVEIGPLLLSFPRVVGLGVTVLTTLLLWLVLNRTDTGKAIRAVAKEKLGASLVGISVPHVYAMTFAIGCACLAVAAGLLMPSFYVSPKTGAAFVLVAFTIVVLGGMGSVPGALIGGLVVGLAEALAAQTVGAEWRGAVAFILLILMLLVRPTGLFGRKE